MFNNKQQLNKKAQKLEISKQGWFYNINKKLKWMTFKKKLFYGVNLLVLVIITGGLLVNNYLNQPEGKVLAEYNPPLVEFTVMPYAIPGVDSVDIRFETSDDVECAVTIYPYGKTSPIVAQDSDHSIIFLFAFTNLDGDPATEAVASYDYLVECDTPDNLQYEDDFTTLDSTATGNMQITNVEANPASESATFTWETNKAGTSQVFVYDEDTDLWDNADGESNSYVKSHTVRATAYGSDSKDFEANTTYRYFVVSSTDVNTMCGSAGPGYVDSNGVCSTSAEKTFTTGSNLTISDSIVDPGANSAIFKWKTNSDSNSWVWIAGRQGIGNNNQTRSHYVKVIGLDTNQTYTYYVSSGSISEKCGDGSSVISGESCAATANVDFLTGAAGGRDANVILKVDRDRICDEWLYCNAAVQVTNNKKSPSSIEDMCFSVGVCDQMGEGGECINIVDSPLVGNASGELTFKATKDKNEVSKIKNLSGYSKVGLDWGQRCSMSGFVCVDDNDCLNGDRDICVDAKIDGYYPYSAMQEIGLSVDIFNSGFTEDTPRPWEKYNGGEVSVVDNSLKITTNKQHSGAIAKKIASEVDRDATYMLSFLAKTDNVAGQQIKAQIGPYQFNNGETHWTSFNYFDNQNNSNGEFVKLNTDWHEYIVFLDGQRIPPYIADGEPLNIILSQDDATTESNSFYIDNITMKSVLKLADSPNYVSRSCRMYPDQNAPACSYYDEFNNKDMQGWQGYCIEPDPANQDKQDKNKSLCLQWWPVDVISGEANIFTNDEVAGYNGVTPLYYCLESAGNYPYYQKIIAGPWLGVSADHQGFSSGQTESGQCSKNVVDVGQFGIYKDEIAEVRIDDIRIDAYGDNFNNDGCGVVKTSAAKNPAIENSAPGGKGALIFNSVNKDYWDRGFIDDFRLLDGMPRHTYNKYANLECFGNTDNDNMNFVTAFLTFDDHDKLTQVTYKYCDGENGAGPDYKNDGASKYSNINITFKGERCNVIARVVDFNGENKAWSARIKKKGWIKAYGNDLGYEYEQDYAPYGSSVAPPPADDPTQWEDPLYVMSANNVVGYQQASQTSRAGTPYSITPNTVGYCDAGENAGSPCNDNDDCNIIQGICLIPNKLCSNVGRQCPSGHNTECKAVDPNGTNSCVTEPLSYVIGKTQCIAGSINLGQECDNTVDCGGEQGAYCAGVKLETAAIAALRSTANVGWEAGRDRIQELFAKSYGVWQLEWNTEAKDWRYALTDNSWDISGARGHNPTIDNIKIDDKKNVSFEIISQGSAILKFNALVDSNQLPLVSYGVNWGDGTHLTESGLRVGNDTNPHTLVHYYKYDPDCEHHITDIAGDYCEFYPEVTIKDNWGFTATKSFGEGQQPGVAIRVYQEGKALPPGILAVEPENGLTFNSNDSLGTQSFTVSNINSLGDNMHWEIVLADGIFDVNDPNGDPDGDGDPVAKFGGGYYVGYRGILAKSSSAEVSVVIDSIQTLTAGQTYTGVVTIRHFDPSDDHTISTKIITIYLEIPTP